MGYTHYFPQQRPITDEEWQLVSGAAYTLTRHAPVHVAIASELDETDPPMIGEQSIRFNGFGEEGHETFLLRREFDPAFEFCKTARKPYDLIVCAVLIAANHYAPGWLQINSDGDVADGWGEALQWAQDVLGIPELRLPESIQEE